jgi:hypothetical protein
VYNTENAETDIYIFISMSLSIQRHIFKFPIPLPGILCLYNIVFVLLGSFSSTSTLFFSKRTVEPEGAQLSAKVK